MRTLADERRAIEARLGRALTDAEWTQLRFRAALDDAERAAEARLETEREERRDHE